MIPHANSKVKNGHFADEASETFLLAGVRAFLKSLERR